MLTMFSLLDPSSLQSLIPWDSSKQIHEAANTTLLKSSIVTLLFALFPPLRILKSTTSWSLQSRLSSTLTSPTNSHLFVIKRSINASSTSHHWPLYCLGEEALHKPPGLLMPCCVFPLTDTGVKSPMRTRPYKSEAIFSCL